MSVSDKHSIKIEYQTSLGKIQATWESGGDIEVSFLNSETSSFQIPGTYTYLGLQEMSATAQETHENVLLELISRFRDIEVASATHSSEFSGVLGLVLRRSDDSELLDRHSCRDSSGI
jgi:6-phosphogluconate dehydrogenase